MSDPVYGEGASWWNPLRRWVWPRIHDTLNVFGGYALSHVTDNQYVGKITLSADELEAMLIDLGFGRNPWAALKRRSDDRDVSEGSWVYRDGGRWPGYLAKMQLHATVFERGDGDGFDVYAHWEDNYWVSPIDHVDGANVAPEEGVERMRRHLRAGKVSFDPRAVPDPVIEVDTAATG